MRRAALVIALFALIGAACSDDDSGSTTTGLPTPTTTGLASPITPPAQPTTPPSAGPSPSTTAGSTPTTQVAPTTLAPPATTSPTTPATTTPSATTTTAATTATTTPNVTTNNSLTDRFWSVVLVDVDDVLNVRTGPGTGFSKLTSFNPTQTGVVLTGQTAQVNDSTWVEVETEDATGWVSRFFLAEEWDLGEVDDNWDLTPRLDEFGSAVEAMSGLGGAVSGRGLFVVYHDSQLRRWTQDQLGSLMTSGTNYNWSSPGCDDGCVSDTFAGAVGLPFLSVWEDLETDAVLDLDFILLGGNGPFPDEAAIPTQFKNFHWLVAYDPGDDPELDGIDWQTWFIYYDYEDGEARIVGLSRAAWGP